MTYARLGRTGAGAGRLPPNAAAGLCVGAGPGLGQRRAHEPMGARAGVGARPEAPLLLRKPAPRHCRRALAPPRGAGAARRGGARRRRGRVAAADSGLLYVVPHRYLAPDPVPGRLAAALPEHEAGRRAVRQRAAHRLAVGVSRRLPPVVRRHAEPHGAGGDPDDTDRRPLRVPPRAPVPVCRRADARLPRLPHRPARRRDDVAGHRAGGHRRGQLLVLPDPQRRHELARRNRRLHGDARRRARGA